MKTLNILTALLLFFTACKSPESQSSDDQQADETPDDQELVYEPFPQGFGYMQNTQALSDAVKGADIPYIREHAWGLWAGIMQPASNADWPVWYTWPNNKEVFSMDEGSGLRGTRSSENPTSLIHTNALRNTDTIMDTLSLPWYPIPQEVIDEFSGDGVIDVQNNSIDIGNPFMFNGDIMIPTESFSLSGYDWIRNKGLYKQSTLNELYNEGVHQLEAPQTYIVTKHMYWPVAAEGLTALPVWNNNFPATYPNYAGYEMWDTWVAIDPSGSMVGQQAEVTYLHGVYESDKKTPLGPFTQEATVYGLDDFYYHKVTQEDWDNFDAADKAIINASSYWAYNKPFQPGDYLVTIAMHVNTKEIPTWALQSVWWTDQPDEGPYSKDKPDFPQAKGPWQHYDLTTAYGIPVPGTDQQPVSMNPYIELVIHPVATNCNNCHIRAGWPTGSGVDSASYQNPDCKDLLGVLSPDSKCLEKITLTDFQWTISDNAVNDGYQQK